jgi:heme oxygenase (mycobilin-producing)
MITRINKFKAAEDKSEELYLFLKPLDDYITGSAGCLSFDVLRSHADPACFVAIEKWVDIESHKQSLAGVSPGEMQSIILLLDAPPKGDYYSK